MDGVGLGRNHWSRKTISVDGVEYPSLLAVSIAHDTGYSTVRNWVNRAKRKGRKSVHTSIGMVTW